MILRDVVIELAVSLTPELIASLYATFTGHTLTE